MCLQSKLAEMAKKLAEMSRQLDEARREQQDVRKLNEVYTQRIIEAHATCNRQPATCSRQSAACNMQRAACSTHHTACSRQRCNMQHAADNVATCSRQQIARHALHEGSLTQPRHLCHSIPSVATAECAVTALQLWLQSDRSMPVGAKPLLAAVHRMHWRAWRTNVARYGVGALRLPGARLDTRTDAHCLGTYRSAVFSPVGCVALQRSLQI